MEGLARMQLQLDSFRFAEAIKLNNDGVEKWEDDNPASAIESLRQCVLLCSPESLLPAFLLETLVKEIKLPTSSTATSKHQSSFYVVGEPRRFLQVADGSANTRLLLLGTSTNLAIALHETGMHFGKEDLLETAKTIYRSVLGLLHTVPGSNTSFFGVCILNNLAALYAHWHMHNEKRMCLGNLWAFLSRCPLALLSRDTYEKMLLNILLFRDAPAAAPVA